jgi:hypothetical protein
MVPLEVRDFLADLRMLNDALFVPLILLMMGGALWWHVRSQKKTEDRN